MKRAQRLRMKKCIACALAMIAVLALHTTAGDCGDFGASPPDPACKLSPCGFYRDCRDGADADPDSERFRQVVTVFVNQ
jgi:hypothetical protein